MKRNLFLFVLLLVFVMPALAQGDSVIEVRGDGARAIVLLGVLGGLAVAVWSGLRTHQLGKKLEDYTLTTISDVQLTSELEARYANLPLRHQEIISQLIDIADPAANFWPGDLDDKVVDWLQEVIDGTPLKDKSAKIPG